MKDIHQLQEVLSLIAVAAVTFVFIVPLLA